MNSSKESSVAPSSSSTSAPTSDESAKAPILAVADAGEERVAQATMDAEAARLLEAAAAEAGELRHELEMARSTIVELDLMLECVQRTSGSVLLDRA